MEKKTAAVLFGAVSSEYEVSLRSAASVLRNFPHEKYNVIMLGITRDGRWMEYTGPIDAIESDAWHAGGAVCPAVISPDRAHGGMLRLSKDGIQPVRIDVVFPVMHGEYAEDGAVQGLLELAGIPYVGCGVLASAACMDKEATHILLEQAGIRMTPWRAFQAPDPSGFAALEPVLREALGYPMFVKPAGTGSSVGITKAKDAAMLREAFVLALKYGRKVLVEKAVVGQEVECAVLGNYSGILASTVGEIVPRHEFYDYDGKYLDDSTDLFVPARLSGQVAARVRQTAVKAYAAMGCTGLARVDFFVEADGGIILNEINTIPGFTSISMYPRLFEASGIPYPALIERLLTLAVEKADAQRGQRNG